MTPQISEEGDVRIEIISNSDLTERIVRLTRQGKLLQESPINLLLFGQNDSRRASGNITLVAITDLDLDREPEIVLDIFAYGASCCTLIAILHYDAALEQYASDNLIIRTWGNAPQIVDIDGDGRLEFLTRNEAFHYLARGSTATSAISPIQILRYENQAIIDVTNQFPTLVEQDAQLWLSSAQGKLAALSPKYLELTNVDPYYWQGASIRALYLPMNAYLADMIVLGRGAEGCEIVKTLCENNGCEAQQFVMHHFEDGFCPAYVEEIKQYLEKAAIDDS